MNGGHVVRFRFTGLADYKARVAAWTLLYGAAPVVRLAGDSMVATDGDCIFGGPHKVIERRGSRVELYLGDGPGHRCFVDVAKQGLLFVVLGAT